MKKEDRDLLFGDLCSRLPYGVKLRVPSWDEREMEYIDRVDVLYSVNGDEYIKSTNEDYDFSLEDIKPYLFPLSSMTEEQYDEFFSYYHNIEIAEVKASGDYLKAAYIGDNAKYSWLNKHHFDYRGLIEKGLAIDATNKKIY